MKQLSLLWFHGIATAFLLVFGSTVFGADFCARGVTASQLAQMQITTQSSLRVQSSGRDNVDRERSISARMSGIEATVVIDEKDELKVVEADGASQVLGRLNSGDDYRGWDALWVLEHGWLYADGVQYDSLLRIAKTDGKWTLTDHIGIRDPQDDLLESSLARLFRLDEKARIRDHLTGLVTKSSDRYFSPALKTVLFLGDAQQLDNGKFVPMKTSATSRYYGDLKALHVALLRDTKGRWYAYDGKTGWLIKGGETIGLGWLRQPVSSRRAFFNSGAKVFEFRGDSPDALRIVELRRSDLQPVGWVDTVVLGDGSLILVGRHAIYQSVGDVLQPVWMPPGSEIIYGPKDANRLADGALIVTTMPKGEQDGGSTGRFHLLSRCAGSPAQR